MKEDRVFLDTNILVYAHDVSAGNKHEFAKNLMFELWEDRRGVLSTQVLQEFFHVMTRKLAQPLSTAAAKEIVEFLLKWNVVVNTGNIILRAIDLHQKYKYSFWDSIIVATAVKGSATLLLSEDLSDGQIIEGVTIRNPFK